jgi:phosphoribosylformimino-5-aminoimidazole carboxamide ribotide isomerase
MQFERGLLPFFLKVLEQLSEQRAVIWVLVISGEAGGKCGEHVHIAYFASLLEYASYGLEEAISRLLLIEHQRSHHSLEATASRAQIVDLFRGSPMGLRVQRLVQLADCLLYLVLIEGHGVLTEDCLRLLSRCRFYASAHAVSGIGQVDGLTATMKSMLIPSIDLMGGRIVQLVQGEKLKLAFDDFEYWIERFSKYPVVQLIDLDAAMRHGENRRLIEMICKRLPCQVGGGLKTAEDGKALLEAGARRVIYGSSLFGAAEAGETRRHTVIRLEFAEGLKRALGEEALVFSVDTKGGRVAVKGWKDSVDLTPEEAVTWLEDCCAAFLYTHVDTEGTMQGFPLDVAAVLRACTAKQLIVAGGIKERSEVDALDAMGVDAVAGMAVYSGAMEA